MNGAGTDLLGWTPVPPAPAHSRGCGVSARPRTPYPRSNPREIPVTVLADAPPGPSTVSLAVCLTCCLLIIAAAVVLACRRPR